MDGIVIVGLIIGLISYLMGSVATNIQLLSHRKDAEKPPSLRIPYIKRWLWWVGFITSIVASLLTTGALALAPATLISPLSALALIFTAILGHYINRESIRGIIIPTLLIVVSGIITSIVSSKDSVSVTPAEMIALIVRPQIIAYYAVIISMWITMEVYVAIRLQRATKESYFLTVMHPEDRQQTPQNLPIIVERLCTPQVTYKSCPAAVIPIQDVNSRVSWKEKKKYINDKWGSAVKPARYSMTSNEVITMELLLCFKAGLLGSQSVTISKVLGSLILGFANANIGLFKGIFSHWLPPVAVVLLVSVTLGQVKLQQDALKY